MHPITNRDNFTTREESALYRRLYGITGTDIVTAVSIREFLSLRFKAAEK